MMDSKGDAFQLKRSNLTLTEIALKSANLNEILLTLEKKADIALDFLSQSPVVINFQSLPETAKLDIAELIKLFQNYQLLPFAYKNADNALKQQAEAAGLIPIKDSQQRKTESSHNTENDIKKTPSYSPTPAKIIKGTIRSGQQILAQGDLIIIGSVSETAEVLAVGNIHIYGTLRGRALAGISGNQNSLIYCQNMQAEMLSIAGIYQISEDMPDNIANTPLLAQLQNGKISYMRLNCS